MIDLKELREAVENHKKYGIEITPDSYIALLDRLESAEKGLIEARKELDTEMGNHRRTFKKLSKGKFLWQAEVLDKLADDMEWCDYRPSSTSVRNKASVLRRQAEE